MKKPFIYQLFVWAIFSLGMIPFVHAYEDPHSCKIDAGTLTVESAEVALVNGKATLRAKHNKDWIIPEGYSVVYLLTSGQYLTVVQLSTSPEFEVSEPGKYAIHTMIYDDDPHSDNYIGLQFIIFGYSPTYGLDEYYRYKGWCYDMDVQGSDIHVVKGEQPKPCLADAGTLKIDDWCVFLENGQGTISASRKKAAHVPDGFDLVYVLTFGDEKVIEAVNDEPIFTVDKPGTFTIHTLVYDPRKNSHDYLDLSFIKFGETRAKKVQKKINKKHLCADLDLKGAESKVEKCEAFAGTLSAAESPVMLINGSAEISAIPNGDIHVPNKYTTLYVLTQGNDLVIVDINDEPIFTVNETGNYIIHTLVYDAIPSSDNFLDLRFVSLGSTKATDVLDRAHEEGLCISLDVDGAPILVEDGEVCTAEAGTLSSDVEQVNLFGEVTLTADPNGDAVVPDGYSVIYVLTGGEDLVILQVSDEPVFTVDMAGNYTIHTLVYNADPDDSNFLDLGIVEFGTTTGVEVADLIATSGICASLDVKGVSIRVVECEADAGTLTAENVEVNFFGTEVALSATLNGDGNVPTGYSVLFVLTEGENLIIQQVGDTPNFLVNEAGDYTIHTLVYNADPSDPNFLDLSVVVLGTTSGVDVLNIINNANLCASLDVAGAKVSVVACEASAGTLIADVDAFTLAGEPLEISATPNGDANVPEGYSVLYVLTAGDELVILQVSDTPSFTVDSVANYTIHTLVYNANPDDPNYVDLSVVDFGATTGVDVLNLINSLNICASLDLSGANISITACEAEAGTLTADMSLVTLIGDDVDISATPNGDINVPGGYSVIYVLTGGEDLVILQVSDTPNFTVDAGGNYTIHTLVYNGDSEDPNFLDLGVVDLGTTTGVDIALLIEENKLCADLDVIGASIRVEECEANAGTLSAVEPVVNYFGTEVAISATLNGDGNVPTGYSVLFVLTEGDNLLIQQVGDTPNFIINEIGDYTIHTLVYNADPGNPNFLDLGVVVIGETTGGDVFTLINDAEICASLDVAGAKVSVVDCEADAGTLTADAGEVILVTSEVTISATPNGDINIPTGYSTLFVLTQGDDLVIQQVSDVPEFVVNETGSYTIHTLVFNANEGDPNFLDLSIVELGATTGGEVLTVITNAGICAALDVAGAQVTVVPCTAASGSMTATESELFLLETEVSISATANGDANIPEGYAQIFVLTQGSDLVIVQVSESPEFIVSEAGEYTIHSLVFDPDPNSANYLDLSVVNIGTTTGGDVLQLIGDLCADLDVTGAAISVKACEADAGTIVAVEDTVFFSEGNAGVSALIEGVANVPDGYELLYVLTSGEDLVIEQVGPDPFFTVNEGGLFTIHTLVYDADPASSNYLDLSVVELGVTTAGAVLQLVGDASLCVSLDVEGAPVFVDGCPAYAGTLTAASDVVFLIDSTATLEAIPNGDINVPEGFSVIYLLTGGEDLVIRQLGDTAIFEEDRIGSYTLHTLVYNANPDSEDFLDLSFVKLDTTSGVDVLFLIETLGVCADLDVRGAGVRLQDGGLNTFNAVPGATSIRLNWDVSTMEKGSMYVLEKSLDGVNYTEIAQVEETELVLEHKRHSYQDMELVTGKIYYRLHILSRNNRLLDTQTTSVDVTEQQGIQVVIYPNPTTEWVHIEYSDFDDDQMEIRIYNMQGQLITSERQLNNENQMRYSVGALPSGLYRVILNNSKGDVHYSGEFLKN